MQITKTVLALAMLAPWTMAQDVAVSRVASGNDIAYYGNSGGIQAYAIATTSCNVGNQLIDWFANDNRHPVIAQNFFRVHDGRIEQLGYSWLKHGFCAVNENSCGSCQNTNCNTLGLGCADTYGSGLNDGSGGATKSEINANTGVFQYPPLMNPTGNGTLRGRLQVKASEMGIPGATYLAESQYVTQDDQLAGFARNNSSWILLDNGTGGGLDTVGGTQMGDPGIYAWAAIDSSVTIEEAPNLDEGGNGVHGWFFVGYNVTQLSANSFRYEYAVQNMTSDQSGQSFSIPNDCGATITDPFFRDVDHHSGDPYSNADWTFSNASNMISWSTQTFASNPNANALRWGTLYNFGFTADVPPASAQARIGLFKPGSSSEVYSAIEGPCGGPICGSINYCTSAPNSVNAAGAQISTFGSISLSNNNLSLLCQGAVPNQFGLFFYGPNQISVAFGDGFRCVGGSTTRISPAQTADFLGDYFRPLDNTMPPLSSGPGIITAGSTHNFQCWYRDPAGTTGFNLSDGVSVTFCP